MKAMKLKLPKPSKLWNKFVSRAIGSQMRQTSTQIAMELLDDAGLPSQEEFDKVHEETKLRLDELTEATKPGALSQHIDYPSLAESISLSPLAAAIAQDPFFIQNLAQELLREGSVMDELASKIADKVDDEEVASHIAAEDVAQHMCCDSVADSMSKSEVADQIDTDDLASKVSDNIELSEVASHMEINPEDFAPHMEIDTSRVEDAVIEYLHQNISISVG